MQEIIAEYRHLLAAADAWLARCGEVAGEQLRCGAGCAGCCHGLFDITFLDALMLQEGLAAMPAEERAAALGRAGELLGRLQRKWPSFQSPYLLNDIPQEEWDSPEENATPCPLLDSAGRCRVYHFRPLTCRLHGIPHVDRDGEIFEAEWCTLNFPDTDPLATTGLRGEFRRLFSEEARLLRALAARLGVAGGELDTYIATALLSPLAAGRPRGE